MAKKSKAPESSENSSSGALPQRSVNAKPPVRSRQPAKPEEPGPPIPKPGKVTAIGGMRLGSGISNVLVGLIGCCFILPVLLIPLGIVEIISGSNLLKAKPGRPSTLRAIPILEIVAIITCAAWVSMVVGIISLVFLGDQRVKSYLNQL